MRLPRLWKSASRSSLPPSRLCSAPFNRAGSPLDHDGLVVWSGPHESCRAIGAVPPASRDVIEHGCQKSPLDVATWCRITTAGVSGWVPDGFLERQN